MMRRWLSLYALACFWTFLPAQEMDFFREEIDHVVVVMLENRSFDNVLAWLYDQDTTPQHFIPSHTERRFRGLAGEDLSRYTNYLRNPLGEIIFGVAPIRGLPSLIGDDLLNSPKFNPHEHFPHVTIQLHGANGEGEPTMTGFVQDYATLWDEDDWADCKADISAIMETYTDKELPVMHGLARHYAVCDYWFSSVPTQTNPNRAYLFCGTSEGQTVNGHLGTSVFRGDTLWNRFDQEAPEVGWSIFWQSERVERVVDGCFSGPKTFAKMDQISHLQSHFHRMDRFHELARAGQLPDISFIEPQWTICANISLNDPDWLLLYYLGQNNVFGLEGNDFHPPGDVRCGEDFLANIYTSLIANPAAWQKTLLVITFDEHGGLFDHVVPPKAIAPDDNFSEGFTFDRFGVRIPTILVSPKVQKGTIVRSDDDAFPFDHTSVPATLFKWKKIDQARWNLGKRIDVAPTFEQVIALQEARQDPVLAPPNALLPSIEADKTINMGDKFYLRDPFGNYFAFGNGECKEYPLSDHQSKKVQLEFSGGTGPVTHGSFALIQSHDPQLDGANILETSLYYSNCKFSANNHFPQQWWTIKRADQPYVGLAIQDGDRIYLENHNYLNLLHLVPCRLASSNTYFDNFLKTYSVTDNDSANHYWIIEKE